MSNKFAHYLARDHGLPWEFIQTKFVKFYIAYKCVNKACIKTFYPGKYVLIRYDNVFWCLGKYIHCEVMKQIIQFIQSNVLCCKWRS